MIRKIRICEFKSLQDVEVELDPLTVLIGRSGVGKSNFADAIRFLRDYLTSGTANQFLQRAPQTNLLSIIPAGRTDANLRFEVNFELPAEHGLFSYFLHLSLATIRPQQPVLMSESLQVDGRTLFDQAIVQNLPVWRTAPQVIGAPGPGALAIGQLFGIPVAKRAHLALTTGLGCYDFPGEVLQITGTTANSQALGLDDRATNFFGVVETLVSDLSNPGRFREIVRSLQVLVPSVRSLDIDGAGKRIVVSFEADGHSLFLPLERQSEGFRRFLAHLLALDQNPAKLTAVFEEPEKGIYPGALEVLADHFRASAEKHRTQCVLITQSPDLLGHFPVQSLRVVTMDNYQTKIGPVAHEQAQAVRDSLLTTSELLTVDEARLQQTQ
jgi:predicted ATPase